MSMSRLHRFVVLAAVVPTLAFLLSSAFGLFAGFERWRAARDFVQVAELAAAAADLAHELQRERGLGSSHLSAQGDTFRAKLAAQRQLTDQRLGHYLAVRQSRAWASIEPALAGEVDAIDQDIARRVEIKAKADGRQLPVTDYLAYYTDLIGQLIALTNHFATIATEPTLSRLALVYGHLLMAKEKAGNGRATGAVLFNQGLADPAIFNRFVGLVAVEQSYFDMFRKAAPPELQQFLAATVTGPKTEEALRYRGVLLDLVRTGGDRQGLKAADWYALATHRIDQMKVVEDRVSRELDLQARTLRAEALRSLFLIGGPFLAMLLATLLLLRHALCGISALRAAETQARAAEAEARAAETKAQATAEQQRRAAIDELAGRFKREIGTVVERLAARAGELEARARDLDREAEAEGRRSEELAATSGQTSDNVRAIAAASEELAATTREIAARIDGAGTTIHAAAEKAEATDRTVAKLDDAATRIGEVVTLIATIAKQTSLLALNATIEAARAGEAGRGFAVVAQEVKALAGQTAQATEQIGAQVEAVRAIAVEAGEAMRAIRGTVAELETVTLSVAGAAEEESAATADIARNATGAAAGTGTVAAHADGIRAGAATTSQAAHAMLSATAAIAA
jgi:methyl-accepting chemotaxis protein